MQPSFAFLIAAALWSGMPLAANAASAESPAPVQTQPQASRAMQVNASREPSEVALNQPVRLEFTTMPRQIDGIDIATAVTSSLALAGNEDWRLLGRPVVNDQDTKSRLVKVVVTLLPRSPGLHPIPDIPITWLQGNYIAHVEPVKVQERLWVAGAMRELPKEVVGIADWKWESPLAEAEKRIVPELIQRAGERVTVRAGDGLVLDYVNRRLAQGTMTIPDLELESGRIDFLRRWGMPIDETQGQLRWILGWTVITAMAGEGGKGTTLVIQREDIMGELARSLVKTKVFDVLDRK